MDRKELSDVERRLIQRMNIPKHVLDESTTSFSSIRVQEEMIRRQWESLVKKTFAITNSRPVRPPEL